MKRSDILKCPYCSDTQTKVLESRDAGENENVTRRRRECLRCEKRFTTYERVEMTDLIVIKKDGKREIFDKDKIRRGLLRACEKRDINLEQIEKLINAVEVEIRLKDEREIPSKTIGRSVMKHLRKIDNIAYIRFASVYREFTDLESFHKEFEKLLKRYKNEK